MSFLAPLVTAAGEIGAGGAAAETATAAEAGASRGAAQAVTKQLSTQAQSKVSEALKEAPKRFMDAAWGAVKNDLLAHQIDKPNGHIPRFAHSITVNVKGGPGASLRRIWWLACAACFGRYKRGVLGFWARSINAQWNITGKEVSITLAYTFSGVTEAVAGVFRNYTGLDFLQRGPDQVTIGSGYPAWMFTTRQNLANFANRIGAIGKFGAGLAVPGGIVGGAIHQLADPVLQGQQARVNSWQFRVQAAGVSTRIAAMTWLDLTRANTNDPQLISNHLTTGPTVLVRILEPYRVRYLPNVIGELPIQSTFAEGFTERLPFRRQTVTDNSFAYTDRGGLYGYTPLLPDDGRLITTGEKRDPRVQPPKPPADGVSRGNPLALITAALASPGYLVAPPKSTFNLLNNPGLYFNAPGTAIDSLDLIRTDPAGRIMGVPPPAVISDLNSQQLDGSANVYDAPTTAVNIYDE